MILILATLFLCMGHIAFLIAHQTMLKFISYIDNVWGAICAKIHFWQAFRKASLGIYGNHSEIFDMDHKRHFRDATTVEIYEISGYLRTKSHCWTPYKLQTLNFSDVTGIYKSSGSLQKNT